MTAGPLRDPIYSRLFEAIRKRMESAGSSPVRHVTLKGLNDSERRAIADLMGWDKIPWAGFRINVQELDQNLRASNIQLGLRETILALGGPLRDLPAEKAKTQKQEMTVWDEVSARPSIAERPALRIWIQDRRQRGRIKRAAKRTNEELCVLLEKLLRVLGALPAQGEGLATLAARLLGDAHALDAGQPLAGLVLSAGAALLGREPLPTSAIGRRHLWAALGVACDPLSSQVLVLGLRPLGQSMAARHLGEASEAGEPRRLTLREVVGTPLDLRKNSHVFLCENPSLVAKAADKLGASCAPLICMEGQPSVAALGLCAQLAGTARLSFHADFDWAGIRIGNLLLERLSARPWRFCKADYLDALNHGIPFKGLRGHPTEAIWDKTLGIAMIERTKAVYEEQVTDLLLADLAI